MSLSREDKIWLAQLAALVVRALSEVICGSYKTAVSVERTKDIIAFGHGHKSLYLGVKGEGTQQL